MKKLITIILALIMTLISAPNQGADQPHVTAVNAPQTAITVQVEQVPEESETTAETAFVGEVSKTETTVESEEPTVSKCETDSTETEVFTEEKIPSSQEIITEEGDEITEEKVITETNLGMFLHILREEGVERRVTEEAYAT
ncbi:MAG: hypothetical protein E7618_02565 [Ruminococcaceae bacterium]|nr:hypothetical protein [Oscillospiraceae bacterium]